MLIAGGAGFIGPCQCDALAVEDKEITILDNLTTGAKKILLILKEKSK